MSHPPQLGPRTIVAYNKLAAEIGALNYLLRAAKPAGPVGPEVRSILWSAIRRAQRVFRREAGLLFIGQISPTEPMSMADLTLVVARLTTAATMFEERYHHLTEAGLNGRWS